ncbi:regulator of G-protein signaling loco isoform X3 [Agrilus planipennis]|uniref:Regulator of G-protein signaling loco isoform X3 n=1 Tax=Agrilus planipennis TaxID=224129 RepID=A0A1W4X7W1_AGRPL|nr:regulator of G-protein signaling loco isoform X3 [Agrilus planipennis]
MKKLTQLCGAFSNKMLFGNGENGNVGTGLVVALKPPFKRFQGSFRRAGSCRSLRRPASFLATLAPFSKDDENGLRKNERPEGPSAWATSFEKLLEDTVGLQTFAAFLKKEFSAENIYFWTACERYRRNPSVSERATEAQKIYKRHLCLGAPEPVNVDSQGRQITEQSLQEARCSLFDQAQKQIFNLMKFDSYPRFLKSDLYKQCLAGNADVNFDDGLLIYPTSVTPTKLKKSLSNAEDRRRKSLLPWHRKNRSKSKDRGETEYNLKKDTGTSNDLTHRLGRSEIHNSKTSLISQESGKFLPDDSSLTCRNPLCRVILNNGSTTVVQIKKDETIQELINRVLEKRGIVYSCYEVFTDKHSKPLDVREPSTTLSGCEVKIEQRVIFKLYLPNKKVIAVKSKYTKILMDVLKPILCKYDYKLDNVNITVGKDFVDVYQPVTSVEEKRLIVQLKNGQMMELGQKIDDKPNNIPSLETVTNRVFKDILNEKGDTRCSKPKSDQGSLKSDGWGSENSSSIFGKLLKKEPSEIYEKRKKQNAMCSKSEQVHSCEDESYETNTMIKRPLIAKWKTGAKLHLPSPESDVSFSELYEGLKRAQRSRLEDQRGTEINFELPDFLKAKTNDRLDFSSSVKQTSVNTKLHINNNGAFNNSNNNNNNNSNNNNKKPNNFRIYSPNKLSPSISSSPLKCSNEKLTEVSEKSTESFSNASPRPSEPPPLPPKPKIVPAKPSNWGQNGLVKYIQKTDNSNLYLEQPTSSFV